MATPLTNSINALTAYANEVTGGSDTNLSDAVHTLASGYGGGMTTGTYIPEANSSEATIDTGKTGWTHFLIVPHTLPYAVPYVRCLGLKYVDVNGQFAVYSYGASSDSERPSTGNSVTANTSVSFSQAVIISETTITFTRLISSQQGAFQAGTQYDWYAW